MPKVVPEYKELAKKKIIDAAYSIFYKKGYHGSTMDDISNEVGVSKHHYILTSKARKRSSKQQRIKL